MLPVEKTAPPPPIVVFMMSGLETIPIAKSAAVIVEVTRISRLVWVGDIDNSDFMNICTIYRFNTLVFLITVTLCIIGNATGDGLFVDNC
jgi:hypothetical protein